MQISLKQSKKNISKTLYRVVSAVLFQFHDVAVWQKLSRKPISYIHIIQ